MMEGPLAQIAALLDKGERAEAGLLLDTMLMAKHGGGETRLLCDLHRLAVTYWQGDAAQAAFHRTHAYVYALEGGFEAEALALHDALAAEGRI